MIFVGNPGYLLDYWGGVYTISRGVHLSQRRWSVMKKLIIGMVVLTMAFGLASCYYYPPVPPIVSGGGTVMTDSEKVANAAQAAAGAIETKVSEEGLSIGEENSSQMTMQIGNEMFSGPVKSSIKKGDTMPAMLMQAKAAASDETASVYTLSIEADLSSAQGNKIAIAAAYLISDGTVAQSNVTASYNEDPIVLSADAFQQTATAIASSIAATEAVADIANAFSKDKVLSEFEAVVEKASDDIGNTPIVTENGLTISLKTIVIDGESHDNIYAAAIQLALKGTEDVPVSVTFGISSESGYSACFKDDSAYSIKGSIDVTISGATADDSANNRGTVIKIDSVTITPSGDISVNDIPMSFEAFTTPISFVADPKLSPVSIKIEDLDTSSITVPAKDSGLEFIYDGTEVKYSDVYDMLDEGTSFPG